MQKIKWNRTKKYHRVTSINNLPILIFSVRVKTHTISNIHTNLTYMHTKIHFIFLCILGLKFSSFPSLFPFLPSYFPSFFPLLFLFLLWTTQIIILVSGSAHFCLLTHSTITAHLCNFQLWWYLDEKISFSPYGLHSLLVRWIHYIKASAVTIGHCIWILCKFE